MTVISLESERNAFSADVCEWFWFWIESYISEFVRAKYTIYLPSFLAAIHYFVAFPLVDILFITKEPLLIPKVSRNAYLSGKVPLWIYTVYTDRSASYLDLHLEIDHEGRLRTKLYDKRDDFKFPIVNFPFICSNIPAAPAYGVYISQMIRYSRTCGSYQDFLYKGLLLTRKLLNQGFLLGKWKSSLRKLYGRHHDLVDRYGISVSIMTTDMFYLS